MNADARKDNVLSACREALTLCSNDERLQSSGQKDYVLCMVRTTIALIDSISLHPCNECRTQIPIGDELCDKCHKEELDRKEGDALRQKARCPPR
jgi:hypothetical protein